MGCLLAIGFWITDVVLLYGLAPIIPRAWVVVKTIILFGGASFAIVWLRRQRSLRPLVLVLTTICALWFGGVATAVLGPTFPWNLDLTLETVALLPLIPISFTTYSGGLGALLAFTLFLVILLALDIFRATMFRNSS